MAETDRAIVVGVTVYPFLGDLAGPENDAKAFHQWLIDEQGGAVPPAGAKRILSSDWGTTPNPLDVQPTVTELERVFDELYLLGEQKGGKAGRRLYIYLAGHGFAPALEDAALLMANAARGRSGHHVSGRAYANWFRQSAFFDEVLLFMDCCREASARAAGRPVPYELINGPAEAHHLYGFATEWSRASREVLVNGEVRGLFTIALLQGLRGSAVRDATGAVTAQTLRDFVHNYLPKLTERHKVDRQDPVFSVWEAGSFPLATPPPLRVRLRVKVAPPDFAQAIELLDGALNAVPRSGSAPALREWDVAPATYQLRVGGAASRFIEVLGEGGMMDVDL